MNESTVEIRNEYWRIIQHPVGASEVAAFVQRKNSEFNVYRTPKTSPEELETGRDNGNYWTDLFGRFSEKRIFRKNRDGYRQLRTEKELALHGVRCDQSFEVKAISDHSSSFEVGPDLNSASGQWRSAVSVTRRLLGPVLEKTIRIEHLDEDTGLYAIGDHPFFVDAPAMRLTLNAMVTHHTRPMGGLEYPVPWQEPEPIEPGSEIDFSQPRHLPADRDESLYGLSGPVSVSWDNGIALQLEAEYRVNSGKSQPVEILHYYTGRQSSQGISAVELTMGGANWNGLYKLGFIPSKFGGVELCSGDVLEFVTKYTITRF